MEDHATAGTVPESLHIDDKAKIKKPHHREVNLEIKETKKVFWKTILASIRSARKTKDKMKAQAEA